MENYRIYSFKRKLFIIFILYIEFHCQVNDNYERHYLENGTYDLLDITDNYDLKIIVSTSKNIYTGIPPVKKVETQANLINSTSLLTINENYLLAACLKDSLLTKININNGMSSSLINYQEINISPPLEYPIKTCSISTINNFIFIAYSRIDYYEDQTNKTNIIFKLEIKDKYSDNGPI